VRTRAGTASIYIWFASEDGAVVWGAPYEITSASLPSLQDDSVVEQVAQALSRQLTAAERERLNRAGRRGSHGRVEGGPQPGGHVHGAGLRAGTAYRNFDWPRVLEETAVALSIDPNLHLAHTARARVLYHYGLFAALTVGADTAATLAGIRGS
jgi:hypothetical protein